MKRLFALGTLAAGLAIAAPAFSAVTFAGSSGSRSATVTFDLTGSSLHVVLTNAGAGDTVVPTDVLTGVFFNIAGNPALTRVSAVTIGATTVAGAPFLASGSAVGGEWSYLNGLSQYGANSGISASGLGVFGPGNVFPPGVDLAGGNGPGGVDFGLATAGDNPATVNGGTNVPLTKNAVEFVLNGFTFGLSSISAITFQYGTALTEPSVIGSCTVNCSPPRNEIPEPASLALVGLALAGAAASRRRIR